MLNRYFVNLIEKAVISDKKVALIILDLDLFKDINDQFGHGAGDEVLISFSKIIKKSLPNGASAFRLGGEEFALIFLAQDIDNSANLAENIRRASENKIYNFNDQLVTVTVSAGVALLPPQNLELSELMKKADKRLYMAKNQGRNQVIYED